MKNFLHLFILLLTQNISFSQYCSSNGNGSDIHIFSLGSRYNSVPSGNNGYYFHTNTTFQMPRNYCNLMSVGIKPTGSYTGAIAFRVWIDFNNDNVFNNANELVYQAVENITYTGAYFSYTVFPDSMYYGIKRMRTVAVKGNVYPSACSIGTTGETEDINVNIVTADQYCSSKGSNTNYEYINSIQIASLTHTTGNNGGYNSYCSSYFSMQQSISNTVSINVGYPAGSFAENVRIYMDYNNDGDYADAGELAGSGSGVGTIAINVTPPYSYSNKVVRMRVQMKYGSYTAGPCETFTYGEVEDYGVRIWRVGAPGSEEVGPDELDTRSASKSPSLFDLTYTISSGGSIEFLSKTDENQNSEFILMDLNGKMIYHSSFRTQEEVIKIDMANAASGIYIARLQNGENKRQYKINWFN